MKKKQLVATADSDEDVDSAMTPRYAFCYRAFIRVHVCVCSFSLIEIKGD